MKDDSMQLLEQGDARKALIGLMKASDEISFAVAWATPNTVCEALLEHVDKIKHAIFGTHLFQTSPKVLDAFVGSPVARYLPPSGPLFHPKLYLFRKGTSSTAVIGSHNFTAGAFDKGNIEASLLIEGDVSAPVMHQCQEFIRVHWSKAKAIADDDFLYDYRVRYEAAVRERERAQTVKPLTRPRSQETMSPFFVSWAEFVRRVKNDQHHSLEGRLNLLRTARDLFLSKTFAAMSVHERKAIAGTYGKTESRLGDLDWAWFGSMQGAGVFKSLVLESPDGLSAALDAIPQNGEVTREHFNRYIRQFDRAFLGKPRKGGVATASRLLALKRPDWFMAINEGNLAGISDAFGVARTRLKADQHWVETYWERLVEPLRLSEWWHRERPIDELDGQIWDNRAALLDSLYYNGLGNPE